MRPFIAPVLVLSSLATLAAPQAPQQPVPRFGARVDLVTVDVSVLDRDRMPVRGLTPADFTILEDGQPQPVQAFNAIDLPDVEIASAPWLRDVTPDVRRNDDLADRRIVAIILDDALPMDVGPGVPALDGWVRKMASEVVNQMGPRDLAAVVYPLDKSGGQDFTSDRSRLLAAIDRYHSNTSFSPDDAPGTIATRRRFLYDSLLSTIQTLTEYLSDLPQRRKALILLSEGIPLDVEELGPRADLSNGDDTSGALQGLVTELRQTFDAAQRANVNIYPIDPGGLRVASSFKVDFLKGLAANTGGYAVVDTNDTSAGVRQIFRENSSYYLLGYATPNPRMDGRFRRIQVKVNRPGLTVRARTGYFAPRPEKRSSRTALPPDPIWKALAAVVPTGDVAMQACAIPLAVAGRRESAVALVAGLRQPAPVGVDRVVEQVEMLVHAFDPKGNRRAAERLNARIVLRPNEQGADVSYELLSRLDLPPGRYQVRLAASSAMQGKSGSVFLDVDVPDFAKPALSMSPVVLSADPALPIAPKDTLAALLPIVPTTRRDFVDGDQVVAFVRLYQGGRKPPGPVSVTTRLVDGRGATAFDTTAVIDPGGFGTTARSADYRVPLPLDRLAPGPHLLTVDATLGKTGVHRDVRFTVRTP